MFLGILIAAEGCLVSLRQLCSAHVGYTDIDKREASRAIVPDMCTQPAFIASRFLVTLKVVSMALNDLQTGFEMALVGHSALQGRRLTTMPRNNLLRRSTSQYHPVAVASLGPVLQFARSPLRRRSLRRIVAPSLQPPSDDAPLVSTPRQQEVDVSSSQQLTSTVLRVAIPTALATVLGYLSFEGLVQFLRKGLDAEAIRILGADKSQFIQNAHNSNGALFVFLAAAAYGAFYNQKQDTYLALFQEVSQAKSLLEQTTLVLQGRSYYQSALVCIRKYVKDDLRCMNGSASRRLMLRPMEEDPLESILYMTSVGTPGAVYETVKSLREARSDRLGAMQRKFPGLGIVLLYMVALNALFTFPFLSAGAGSSAGVLSLQGRLFALECGAHMVVLSTILELWRSSGGVYSVDTALQEMVYALEAEVDMRLAQSVQMQKTMMASGDRGSKDAAL